MTEILKREPVAKQMKNVGVLHKFVKGLQRFVDTGHDAVFSAMFQEKLAEAAKIDGLPVKTVKRITDLLGTIKAPDYQSPVRYTEEVLVPVEKYGKEVDWPETILGPYGETRVEFEDKYSVHIRMDGKGAPGGHKMGPLKLLISSLQRWNTEFAKKALKEYMDRPANHKKEKSTDCDSALRKRS
eukprot:TRINITY_DN3260_c0_g1_i1.p1 TRINITY_DN3260_c0_g1~~TRINITY_DN3260_c0_g1_i1.p1  ORF type:complete len:184 (+),score=44.47 TRINITY_DN3260_c0_g1_i1:630-1181(+)